MKTPDEFNLVELPSRAPSNFHKTATLRQMKSIKQELIALQDRLYAENTRSVLVVLQGMDASGKDGLIRRVFSGLNPQGVRVHSFKEPTELELSHDFLWRVHQQVPPKGMIHVFNRSHYEDVLVTRVSGQVTTEEARRRFVAINNFEKLLQQAGTTILKFYLHVSEEEQRQRLQERITDPEKQWKYEAGDENKAKQWPEYRAVYEDVFEYCNPSSCPWQIIPADQNWYKAYAVASALRDTLAKLDPQYPSSKEERPKAKAMR